MRHDELIMFYTLHPAAYTTTTEPHCASVHLDQHTTVRFDQWQEADSALIAALRVPMTLRLAKHLHRSYGGNGARAQRLLNTLFDAGLARRDSTAKTLWHDPQLAAECAALEGLTHDGAETAQRRALTTVGVSGLTPSTLLASQILTQSGIGKVVVHDPQVVTDRDVTGLTFSVHDVGTRKDMAFTDRVRDTGAQVLVGQPVESGCDLVLVGGAGVLAPERTGVLMRHRVPHLVVTTWQLEGWVGPFVLPYHSSCYQCAQEHGAVSGPSWQVDPILRTVNANGDFARTAALVAAVTATQVLSWVDRVAVPATLNAVVHCAADTATTCVLAVPGSPQCPCHAEFLATA